MPWTKHSSLSQQATFQNTDLIFIPLESFACYLSRRRLALIFACVSLFTSMCRDPHLCECQLLYILTWVVGNRPRHCLGMGIVVELGVLLRDSLIRGGSWVHRFLKSRTHITRWGRDGWLGVHIHDEMVRALAHVRQTRDTTRGLWEIGNLIDGWVLGYTGILIIFPEVVASITTVSATVEPPARVAIRLRRFFRICRHPSREKAWKGPWVLMCSLESRIWGKGSGPIPWLNQDTFPEF